MSEERFIMYVFYFFLFASSSSFAMASFSRIMKVYSEERDEENLFEYLSGRSRCESCGHFLYVLDLIPVFSCLVLGGKCRHCGAHFGYSHFFAEGISGIAGVFAAYFLVPLWGVSGLHLEISAAIAFAGFAAFLFLSAATDLYTGYVWDFSGFWTACFAGVFLLLAGDWNHMVLFCVIGWTSFLVAMTGKAGYGDAAPLSAAFSVAMVHFGVNPFSVEASSVYSIFFLAMSMSGIFHALYLGKKARARTPSFGNGVHQLPVDVAADFNHGFSLRKMHIPLVPHILVAFLITVVAAPYWARSF